MIPSPVNLSTKPSKRSTPSERTLKKRCMIADHSSGSSCSASSIEPLTSAKRTVTCLRSPSSADFEARILSARCFGVPAKRCSGSDHGECPLPWPRERPPDGRIAGRSGHSSAARPRTPRSRAAAVRRSACRSARLRASQCRTRCRASLAQPHHHRLHLAARAQMLLDPSGDLLDLRFGDDDAIDEEPFGRVSADDEPIAI